MADRGEAGKDRICLPLIPFSWRWFSVLLLLLLGRRLRPPRGSSYTAAAAEMVPPTEGGTDKTGTHQQRRGRPEGKLEEEEENGVFLRD